MENMMASHSMVPIIAMAVVYMVLGSLWYSKVLFGEVWMSCCKKEECSSCSWTCYLGCFITALVMGYVMSHFVTSMGAMDAMSGAKVGFWAWLGFIATTCFSAVLWAKKPLKVYFVDVGFYLVVLLLMGAVFAVWA